MEGKRGDAGQDGCGGSTEGRRFLLKMNFSVGVNMYSENVTYFDHQYAFHGLLGEVPNRLLHTGISSSAATGTLMRT